MTFEELAERLDRRAPGRWELYRKSSRGRERESGAGFVRLAVRAEQGWAARWWAGEPAGLRFAASSSAEGLAAAVADASEMPAREEAPPAWPGRRTAAARASVRGPEAEDEAPVEDPPDLAAALEAALSSAGTDGPKTTLRALALRAGRAHERIANAGGTDVSQTLAALDGFAAATSRRGSAARSARAAFRWPAAPADPEALVAALARRLSDAAALPLSERPSPFRTGQWLLAPPVAAAVLAAIAPVFCGAKGPGWLQRESAAAPGVRIVDDAGPEARWDGEGTASRRMLLVDSGEVVARLYDLRAAASAGGKSTGHGVRPSFREPPRCGPRRIFFEAREPASAERIAASVRRGLEARALTAPVRVDLATDRYEVEFTGVSIAGGREQGPVAGARATGRVSELLRRIEAIGSDLEFFPMPFLAGAGTVLVERASFD